jgi:hypothetical protein
MCIGNVHPCMFMCQTEWAREKGQFLPHSCQQLLKARLITGPLGKPYDYIHHLHSINLSLTHSLTASPSPSLPGWHWEKCQKASPATCLYSISKKYIRNLFNAGPASSNQTSCEILLIKAHYRNFLCHIKTFCVMFFLL